MKYSYKKDWWETKDHRLIGIGVIIGLIMMIKEWKDE